MLRGLLNGLYLGAGAAAAVSLMAIGVLVLLSIFTRLFGAFVPGLSEYAGYAMASASFLALAYTFRHGGHIRVRLLLQSLHGTGRRVGELWCLGVGAGLAGYVAWYIGKMVMISYQLGDVSEGSDATPLWIPQLPMAIGAAILTVALCDRFVAVLLGADPGEPGPGAG